MKTSKYPFCYTVNNRRVPLGNIDERVVMSIPISRFKKTKGCIYSGNASNLTDEDIGKKFRMEMLDPVQPGIVTYLGNKDGVIPEGKFKNFLMRSKFKIDTDILGWRVFEKKGKNACIIVVMANKCNVTPVK